MLTRVLVLATLAVMLSSTGAPAQPQSFAAKPSLSEALANLKVPPAWFDSIKPNYDTGKPWSEARLEIRKRMAEGGDRSREGVKLTYLYAQKGDIGNGHELPMYLFMGGEYAWATVEYEKFFAKQLAGNPASLETHGLLCMASCYMHFGEYRKALDTIDLALKYLPASPHRIAATAAIENFLGDFYAKTGERDQAKDHYRKAIALYPTSNQPFGRHLLKRHAAKVQSKLDQLELASLDLSQLRDGVYKATSLGYSDDLIVTVKIANHRIADVQVQHKEKIEQNATVIIPQRIVETQGLKVDAITGATVTCQAIVDGTFQALKKAGLK